MSSDMISAPFDADTTGIILVDHGSRRAESNELLLEVVAAYDNSSDWRIVEPAHMELAEPSIETAFGRCLERGAERVVVFPYFLSPGRHWNSDIPRLAGEASQKHGNIPYVVTAPLGLHELMMQVISDRIDHCLQRVKGVADSCDVCSESTGCKYAAEG
ncbi:MAG: CbiX/SirB N-terminal domain-containing protein [Lacipirellulaceae bacterium]